MPPQNQQNFSYRNEDRPVSPINSDPPSQFSAHDIRMKTLGLLFSSLIIGPVSLIIWGLLMKQYSANFRIWILIISCFVVPPAAFIFAFVSALDAGFSGRGSPGGLTIGISVAATILSAIAPFIYSLIWPLGRK